MVPYMTAVLWQHRAQQLANTLAAQGDMPDGGRVHAAIAQTPRHPLVPVFYEAQPGGVPTEWAARTQRSGSLWLEGIYSNMSLVTTFDPATRKALGGGTVTGVPTSSNTPSPASPPACCRASEWTRG